MRGIYKMKVENMRGRGKWWLESLQALVGFNAEYNKLASGRMLRLPTGVLIRSLRPLDMGRMRSP